MASAISNTHATIFTKFPKCITKVWTPRIVSPVDLKSLPKISQKHEVCLIERIELKVTFVETENNDQHEIDEADDNISDLIRIWQEGKLQWEEIDTALSSGIHNLIKTYANSAKERKCESISVPKAYKTFVTDQFPANKDVTREQRNQANVRRSTSLADIPQLHQSGYAQTIIPDDSASRINPVDLDKMVRDAVKKQRHKSNYNTKSSNAARNILKLTLPFSKAY